MHSPRLSLRPAWVVLAVWLCAVVAGCGTDKPVGDSQKFHPDGIGIELEHRDVPGKPKS